MNAMLNGASENTIELLTDGGFDNGVGWSGEALNIIDGVSHADVETGSKSWRVRV